MAALRLSDSQITALELLRERAATAERAGDPKAAWMGAREGISGTTLEALARKGLALARWTEKPYRRIVGRINRPGLDYLAEREESPR